ncbi:MAG: alpha/beta fold hydrolase [Microbacteriaceae bacterium]|nr:alpha/beta fold hydrolase [Cryobacterium sp.]MCC6376127.1 alpha/beta fold hydrolase [Microbacteriaceae bacterium]
MEIRSGVELPALRENIELHTSDGLTLVGELALPLGGKPVATLICLHPLPTGGGFMDSHIIRKAAARLPALADLAVLRFNFRGVVSPRGKSEGSFGDGIDEGKDLKAAVQFAEDRGLPTIWLVGWSFGTEVALNWGVEERIEGAILLSPPLKRTSQLQLARWQESGKQLVAVIPEFDDYLRPAEARQLFAAVPNAKVVEIKDGKHLWVGEIQTRQVLSEIVNWVNPSALPLPVEWPD